MVHLISAIFACAGLGLVLPLCAEEAGTEEAGWYLTQHRHLRINLPIFFGAGEINFCWNSARQIFIVSLSYKCTTNFGLNVAFLNPSLRWSMLEAFRNRVRSGQARSESHFILSGAVKQTILAITIWILSVSAGEGRKYNRHQGKQHSLIPKCVLLTYQLLNCWQMTSSCNDLVRRYLLGETQGCSWQGHYWKSLITDLIFKADGEVKAGQHANGHQRWQRPISTELLSVQAAISSSEKAIFYF